MKVIFIDYDGTLVTDDKTVTPRTLDALKRAEKAGYEIVICSGRTKDYVARIRRDLGVGRYVIFNNGAGIYDCIDWKVVEHTPIAPESIHMLCDLAIKYQNVYLDLSPLSTQICLQCYHLDAMKKLEADLAAVPSISIGNKHKALAEEGFPEAKLFYFFDINAKGVSKGYGVERFREIFHVARENTIGIGDGENDIHMLNACGYKVAMGNGLDKIKKIADEVVDSNNNDGVAKYIESLVDKGARGGDN